MPGREVGGLAPVVCWRRALERSLFDLPSIHQSFASLELRISDWTIACVPGTAERPLTALSQRRERGTVWDTHFLLRSATGTMVHIPPLPVLYRRPCQLAPCCFCVRALRSPRPRLTHLRKGVKVRVTVRGHPYTPTHRRNTWTYRPRSGPCPLHPTPPLLRNLALRRRLGGPGVTYTPLSMHRRWALDNPERLPYPPCASTPGRRRDVGCEV